MKNGKINQTIYICIHINKRPLQTIMKRRETQSAQTADSQAVCDLWPFTLQKVAFHETKGGLLLCERPRIRLIRSLGGCPM